MSAVFPDTPRRACAFTRPSIPAGANVAVGVAILIITYLAIARACAFDHRAVCLYAAYLAVHVGLPGVLVSVAVLRRPLTWLEAITVAVPVGYAVEILSFLGLAAVHGRGVYAWLPLGWGVFAMWSWRSRGGAAGLLSRPPTLPWWVVVGVGGVLVATIVSAIAHLFVPSPMVAGQPATETFHDWVYLISRVGEIRQRWPLEDPSLAGTPLQYHYFLLVHVAASSLVTGVESSLVLLRLALLPLGWVLVLQTYALGSRVAGRRSAGVLAALLAMVAGEVSFAPEMVARFGGRFVQWLYLSPTFFFGMVFTGALVLLLLRHLDEAIPATLRERVLLAVMAGVATGAKGTVMPPLIVAYGGWIVLRLWQSGRIPVRLVATGASLCGGFAIVYLGAMASWGTGDATLSPFTAVALAPFWQQHQAAWAAWLALGLPVKVSWALAGVGCGAVALIGAAGVRVLAWPFLAMRSWQHDRLATGWLALVGASQFAFGQLLHLDSFGQLYLSLAARLPAAALAAAFMVGAWQAVQATPGALRVFLVAAALGAAGLALAAFPGWAGVLLVSGLAVWLAPRWKSRWVRAGGSIGSETSRWRASFSGIGLTAVFLVVVVQVNQWRLQALPGVGVWWQAAPQTGGDDLAALKEGLRWIRAHTEPESVLVVNAFTSRNLRSGAVATLDRTTVDKYYYYSAYSERRLWVEGPAYLRNHPAVSARVAQADAVFYGSGSSLRLTGEPGPTYVVIDRALRDGVRPTWPASTRVFRNRRLEVLRLDTPAEPALASAPVVIPPAAWALEGDPEESRNFLHLPANWTALPVRAKTNQATK